MDTTAPQSQLRGTVCRLRERCHQRLSVSSGTSFTDSRTAYVSGVPVRTTVMAAFVLSGMLAALASIVYTARLQTGTPILGERILLDVIGAAVIGGTSLFGGKGKVIWTVFGVLFLVLIDTTLKLLGASLFVIYVIKGSVILAAALLDTLRTRYLGVR